MFNKRMFKKINDKKILHKIGKRWVVVSAVLLGLLGGGTVVTHGASHAASAAPVQTTNTSVTKSTQMQVAHQAPKAVTNQTMKLGATNSQAASSKAMLSKYNSNDSYFNSYAYMSGSAIVNNDYNYVNSVATDPELQANSSLQNSFNYDKQVITSASEIIQYYPSPKTFGPDVYGAQRAASDVENILISASDAYTSDSITSVSADDIMTTTASADEYTNSVANSPEVQEDSSLKTVIDENKAIANSDLTVVSCDGGRSSRDVIDMTQAQSIADEASNLFASASDNDKYSTSNYNNSEEESMSLSEQNAEENSATEAQSYMESSLAAQSSANPDVYYSFIPPSYEDAYNSSAQSSDSNVTSTSAELIQSEINRSHRRVSKYLSSANFKGLSRSHRSVTTLKRIRAYKRTRRGRYVHTKFIRPDTKLMVKRVLRRGRTVRLELTNGLLITANKHFVTITRVAKHHIRRNKRVTKRNAKLYRYTKALRKSSQVLRRGYHRANRYTYREAKKFTRVDNVKKRAYRKFMRKHTTRNRKLLRRAQINLNNLVNALLK